MFSANVPFICTKCGNLILNTANWSTLQGGFKWDTTIAWGKKAVLRSNISQCHLSLFGYDSNNEQRWTLIVKKAGYPQPCSLLKPSNYYLARVKLKKASALSGKSSLKTLTAIKKSKTHSHHLTRMDPVQWQGFRTDQGQVWALGGSLGRGCCLGLEKGRGRAWTCPTGSCAPKLPLSLPLLIASAMQTSAAFKCWPF